MATSPSAPGQSYGRCCRTPLHRTARPVTLLRWLLAASWLVCAAGTIAVAVLSAKTVLISGAVLLMLAAAILVLARYTRSGMCAWIALAHLGICILFYLLVVLRNWNPAQAQALFAIMGAIYSIAILPLIWQARQNLRKTHIPGICDGCGYQLRGLVEPRCPECGTAFSQSELQPATGGTICSSLLPTE